MTSARRRCAMIDKIIRFPACDSRNEGESALGFDVDQHHGEAQYPQR